MNFVTKTVRKPKPGNSLAKRHPDIAAQWHPTLNENLTPNDVSRGSNRKVWWLCPDCKHEWQAVVGVRTSVGTGCPSCAIERTAAEKQRAAAQNGNSLAERHPDIAADWHPTRNEDLTPAGVSRGSRKRVWWLCSDCGHEWETRVSSRTANGSGCPLCAHKTSNHRRRLDGGNTLTEAHPDIAAQWHPRRNGDLTPNDVSRGSNRKVWWLCSDCKHEWQTRVFNRTSDSNGCPPCSHKKMVRRSLEDGNSIADAHPDIADEWHPHLNDDFTPSDFSRGSDHHAWWLCGDCGHEWQARIANRCCYGNGCPPCGSKKQVLRSLAAGNSLADTHPEFAAQWHPTLNGDVTPNDVSHGIHKKFWWLCGDCGHKWQASVSNRTATNSGCQPCATKRAAVKKRRAAAQNGNSLAEAHPEIAAEWHPDRNGDVTPADVSRGSNWRAWWLCGDCGREWQARVSRRTSGAGCKACASAERKRQRQLPEA